MQKWNIPMDRAQRADEKNELICLVVYSQNCGHENVKNDFHSLCKIFKCAWKILLSTFRKLIAIWLVDINGIYVLQNLGNSLQKISTQ